MLRLNKLTDYAVVMLCHMGMDNGYVYTVAKLAQGSGVPQPTAAKLMKQLLHSGLVSSQRGAAGGYVLMRPLTQIAISEVITAMEGPIALTACVDGAEDICTSMALCPIKGNWNKVNQAIKSALDSVSLADVTPSPINFLTSQTRQKSPHIAHSKLGRHR